MLHQPRLSHILLIILPLFAAQISLYHASFSVKPASDDFPVVHEILRGNTQGPGVFFRESMSNMHHRPFKSLAIWWFGRLSDTHREFWIRVLHFSGMALYLFVMSLWLSRMRLSMPAVITAAIMLLFHPALPQALSSIDGVDSLMSSALVWLGAWFAFVYRDRLGIAVPATLVCFLLAAGWKEYSFATVPLATWTLLCFSPPKARWLRAAVMFVCTCVVFALILVVRQRAMPGGYGAVKGSTYLSLSPRQWVENAALMCTGLLFFGNSVWVFVHQSLAVFAIVGASVFIAALVIAVGIFHRLRTDADPKPNDGAARWIVFLLVSFIASTFPANVMFHVSEMYLVPAMLPMALLCGMSADGWLRIRAPLRFVAWVIAIVALLSSAWTVHQKVAGLVDVGDRADRQIQQVLSLLPPDAHDLKIALLFDLDRLPPRRTYAVYRMGDEILLVHPMVFDWIVPQRHLTLAAFPTSNPDYHADQYDITFIWDPQSESFKNISNSTRQ